jgi:hypothetical protein
MLLSAPVLTAVIFTSTDVNSIVTTTVASAANIVTAFPL